MKDSFFGKLQLIDRRWIYVMLVIAVAIPFVWEQATHRNMDLPIYTFKDTMGIYNAVEEAPKDKIVLISADWGFGSLGENGPQTLTVIQHLMKRGVRLMVWSPDPAIAGYIRTNAVLSYAKKYHRVEGVDFVDLGFKAIPNRMLFAQAVMDDIPGYFKKDVRGEDLATLPVMKGIHDFSDVWMVYTVGADPTYDGWVGIVEPKYHMKVGFGSTGVMVPQSYPYLESGQLVGMLSGMRGGTEYEKLMNAPGDALYGITRQSMAHLLVILFIILGNIGFYAAGGRKMHKGRLESVK